MYDDDIPNGTVVPVSFVRQAWLSPRGVMHHVNEWQHEDTANVLGYESGDAMCDAGWLHISRDDTMYVRHGMTTLPNIGRVITQAQRDALWDMFMDAHSRREYLIGWQTSAYNILRIIVADTKEDM
jgi:hypothetical protein